jgi:hypothetical protein
VSVLVKRDLGRREIVVQPVGEVSTKEKRLDEKRKKKFDTCETLAELELTRQLFCLLQLDRWQECHIATHQLTRIASLEEV